LFLNDSVNVNLLGIIKQHYESHGNSAPDDDAPVSIT